MNSSIRRNFIIKFITFILFTWIYQKYDNEVSFSKGLKNIYNGGKDSSYIAEYRLLSEQDLGTRLYDNELEEYSLNDRDDGKLRTRSYGSTAYDEFQESCSNDLIIYRKNFKRKCPRRTGLRRLYSNFKRRIFEMVDGIGDEKIGSRRYNIKLVKSILRTWGKRKVIGVCLIPLIGILPFIVKTGLASNLGTISFFTYGILFIIFSYIFIFSIIYTMINVIRMLRMRRRCRRIIF
ncbi:Variable surface protein Vir10-like protein [Plasmodium coatneyi]|uniref:Variable surface protein Vir10-like protein n=1 Tax=Plasmodium coatneyi TaxID=208452 RepID=A0A1B1E6L0_9APIC|nr:Variable surface protein Vir10-like protein [Plasmodium coatneyi]ANQ10399.1 Variable surface protein Vir10-like protein [Plasmodium coatneyi]